MFCDSLLQSRPYQDLWSEPFHPVQTFQAFLGNMGTWHFDHSLLYQSPHKQPYSGHSERSDLLHTTPPTHSKICCWATTILTASIPTYIFAIPCIIPAYSNVELQITRNPVISIYKQQSSFGIRQLDIAPAKRRCFCKSAFCPLEIPMFEVPRFALQPHQLLGLLSFQSYNSHQGLWLFNDSLEITYPGVTSQTLVGTGVTFALQSPAPTHSSPFCH